MGDGYQEVQEVISIHAPTRGATSLKATEYKLSIDFNPRSHERSDNIQNLTFALTKRFQSTLPREERRCMRVRIAAPLCNFNPRSHERSDSNGLMMFDDTLISIHAPTRGATNASISQCCNVVISIHAPTRGATIPPVVKKFLLIFQSTLPREERHNKHFVYQIIHKHFNPRSHERSDQC